MDTRHIERQHLERSSAEGTAVTDLCPDAQSARAEGLQRANTDLLIFPLPPCPTCSDGWSGMEEDGTYDVDGSPGFRTCPTCHGTGHEPHVALPVRELAALVEIKRCAAGVVRTAAKSGDLGVVPDWWNALTRALAEERP